MTLKVILLRAENPGNIGAIARAMANFDLKEMILVNPKCNHLKPEARKRAKHGLHILENAKVVKKIPEVDYIIATTAIAGTRYNPRSPLNPKQLAKIVPKKNVGILFGPESSGLSNKEILKADFCVTIPASEKYPTLNISQAAVIIFYEIFNKKNESIMELASKTDKKILLGYINRVLDKTDFQTKDKKKTQKIIWKRLLGKSFLTKREAFALMGFFKKV